MENLFNNGLHSALENYTIANLQNKALEYQAKYIFAILRLPRVTFISSMIPRHGFRPVSCGDITLNIWEKIMNDLQGYPQDYGLISFEIKDFHPTKPCVSMYLHDIPVSDRLLEIEALITVDVLLEMFRRLLAAGTVFYDGYSDNLIEDLIFE